MNQHIGGPGLKIYAIPALILGVLALYTGLYNLLVYSRQRDTKQLTFGLTCLAIGLYDIFAAGVYNANSVLEASPWQRGQVIMLLISGTALIWFVSEYTSQRPKKLLFASTGYFLVSALIHIFDRSGQVWMPLDQPAIKQFTLFTGLEVTYYEMTPGPIIDVQSLLSLLIFAFIFWMAIRFYQTGHRRESVPLMISLSLFWVGIFNDTLVSSGVYDFVYLIEYSFLAIVILMAFSLSNQIAILARDIQEREERLRSTLMSIDDLVFEISNDGVFQNYPGSESDLRLILPPGDFIGKSYHDILPPELSAVLSTEIDQLVKTNEVRQFDYPLEVSGNIRWFSAKMSMRKDEAGEFAGVTLVSRDITHRKKVEEEVRRLNEELEDRVMDRTKQLEEKNKELEAFSYSISHDLRAPLRAINGFSRILLDDHKDALDSEGAQFLGHIHTASLKMNDLIESLLNLSRLSRQSIEVRAVELSPLVQQVMDDLLVEIPDRVVVFENQLAHGEAVTVQTDAHLLEVLLTNLLSNAIKFSVSRDPAEIKFGSKQTDGRTIFYVEDNGIGFDQANADKIFSPFHRLHSADDFEGMGIGLAIVQRVVKRLGGEIWVDSEADVGTTFYFTLGEHSSARS
jgi:PAS domain S-box-containing protein